ncbi:MAG: hypothetical protein ACSHX6_10125 [Akkermansiaceae bacterium]
MTTKNYTILLPFILLINCCAISAQEETSIKNFKSVSERRLEIISDKIESIGCILNKDAVRQAEDGRAIVLKHKSDPRGDVTVTFKHLVLPKGNWVLCSAKNSLEGAEIEEAPATRPNRMEVVSAIIHGRAINVTPRDDSLVDNLFVRGLYAKISRTSGWDIKMAHSLHKTSTTFSFNYEVPAVSTEFKKKFKEGEIPLINILHKDKNGKLITGALYWFENKAKDK